MKRSEGSWVMLVILAVILDHTPLTNAKIIRFAAWNIRVFGKEKMTNPDVVEIIIKVIQRYDLILIQEIRAKDDGAIHGLLAELNNKTPDKFKLEMSDRLGRTKTKEQYAFLYRIGKLCVADTYQYPDPSDDFQREPYTVLFRAFDKVQFAVMGIHTSPDMAKYEISALSNVIEKVMKRWTENILIAGDLNAGCKYVTKQDWNEIPLRSDTRFHWLISDTTRTQVTTTTPKKDCPYDRLIVHNALYSSILPGSAGVLRFDKLKGLNLNEAQTLLVSDHYPVHVNITIEATRRRRSALDILTCKLPPIKRTLQPTVKPRIGASSTSMAMAWFDIRKKLMVVVLGIIMFETLTSE